MPGAPVGAAATTVTVAVVRAPHPSGQTVSLTLKCVTGTCRRAVTERTVAHVRRATPVGARSYTLRAGQPVTLTILLVASGRRPLARYGKLPVVVTVTVARNGGRRDRRADVAHHAGGKNPTPLTID